VPNKLYNLPHLKQFRKDLRKDATEAEQVLWQLLRNGALDGRKFRRQHSIGGYILDFYCVSEKLSIELDGEGHFTEEGKAYDTERTAYLKECGIRELRFENFQVINEREDVLRSIRECFDSE
jgi:Uncharacterized protein conserved in bacteria